MRKILIVSSIAAVFCVQVSFAKDTGNDHSGNGHHKSDHHINDQQGNQRPRKTHQDKDHTGHRNPGKHLNPEARLGRDLFNDTELSLYRNQSCETCHSLGSEGLNSKGMPRGAPKTATFVDPDNIIDGTAVSDGSDPTKFGTLNAPSAGYAAFSPPFHWDANEGLYFGGQFWNGRASYLRNQAAAPPLNPVEMALPNKAAVIERLKENPDYIEDFFTVYGIDLNTVYPDDDVAVNNAYEKMTLAIEAFERTNVFNRFTSKFDFVETGWTDYTESEQRGADLSDAVCAGCHEGTQEDADGNLVQALMTDFSYDNIGVPANVNIAGGPDLGLGNNRVVIADGRADDEKGKQKVMTLRNIAITPPYMHNGVFQTLEQVVHFYNTRDVLPECPAGVDNNHPDFGVTCWPAPEVAENENTDELGDLGLTPEDEADLVAYFRTFTDGYDQWGKDPNVPKGSKPGYLYTAEEIMPPRPPAE